jgi:hypothetical protein
MSSGGCVGLLEGRDNANFICAGKGIARVPVPVLSGRCSPFSSISRIKERYCCSSCAGLLGGGVVCFVVSLGGSGVMTGSSALGGMFTTDRRLVCMYLGAVV